MIDDWHIHYFRLFICQWSLMSHGRTGLILQKVNSLNFFEEKKGDRARERARERERERGGRGRGEGGEGGGERERGRRSQERGREREREGKGKLYWNKATWVRQDISHFSAWGGKGKTTVTGCHSCKQDNT